jgi:hypothetical protein
LGLVVALALLITACDQNVFIPKVEPETLPLVQWTSPAEMAVLKGNTTFSVAQAGEEDFVSVTFDIDGRPFTRSSGTLTIDVDKLNIAPGRFQAAATATTVTGKQSTAYRTFVIPDVLAPTVEWVQPRVLHAIEPDHQFDMVVRVSDLSGVITELIFYVDDSIVHTMRDVTGVATATDKTFRWRGFYEALGRVTLRVEAYNAAGGMAVATREVLSVDRRPIIIDDVPPLVWWDQSTVWNNRAIAGTNTFKARAEDDVQVEYFEFLINGALADRVLPAPDTGSLPRRSAEITWNTLATYAGTVDGVFSNNQRKYPDGEYQISVVAVDTSGNRSEVETLTVRVANDDKVNPMAQWFTALNPSAATDLYDGKVLTGTANLAVIGWDDHSIDRFEVSIGNTLVGTLDATTTSLVSGYGFSSVWNWDTRTVQSGYHTLAVVAIDQAGNRSSKAFINVIVVNDPPFTLQSRFENYIYSDGTSRIRRGSNQFTLREIDTGYNLTVCRVYLLVAENTQINPSLFGGLGRVQLINDSDANGAARFAVDPESGAYRFNWLPEYAVRRWGVYSTLALRDRSGNGNSNDLPIRFAADVAVSHSQAGCDSGNQAFITYFRTQNYIQMVGNYY